MHVLHCTITNENPTHYELKYANPIHYVHIPKMYVHQRYYDLWHGYSIMVLQIVEAPKTVNIILTIKYSTYYISPFIHNLDKYISMLDELIIRKHSTKT